ncbi:signal peptidase II [Ochrobactrum sp. CM-21-5]|uniref:Lipoprotein signal peptidase n=1 Tax=Falsochrobactrum tianjinense TaxID=2706015 RepID=A0A949PLX9_9HYPH|nr:MULTISPECIES: signal peptidase II [Brucellaceae]MBC2884217.1 signal peptidase II [Ochrobactrum sp. CM-21-5]MBV2142301.1 signal peptidase II [Falsochrobactrum sp. TDYN1]
MKRHAVLSSLLVVILAVALDQFVKFQVETGMGYGEQIDLLPFLALLRVHNEGIAFSMLAWLHDGGLIAITIAVIAFVLYLWWTNAPERVFARYGFALVVGGAIGNLIDRSMHGYVVDYVLFHLPAWSFAIFNLADAFITIGAALIIWEEFLGWRRERAAR